MKNAEGVLGIAQELGVGIKTFIDVISVSSRSSFALRSLGRWAGRSPWSSRHACKI
jgi:hypothetical protein